MKKITKLLISLVSTVLVASNVLTMASCGGSKEDAIKNTTIVTGDVNCVAYDGSNVTITFYHTMGAALKQILSDMIPKFNAMYPNIKVQHASYGDYPALRDQISTELIGAGTAPSIAYCYPDHVALYNKSKAVLTLDDFIENTSTVTKADGSTEVVGFTETQVADFIPAYYEEGRAFGDGLMYTLPMLKSTEILYYNKTYFDANGYTAPTTWEEMETLCETIYEAESAQGYKCIPLGYDSEANLFITMTEQLNEPYTSATGDHYLFNTQKNREFVEMFREWYDKSYMTTSELNGGTYTSDLFKQTDKSKLHSYMSIGSSAGAGYQCPTKQADGSYPFEVGITMIPQVDTANPQMISQGPSVCMFKKSNEQEMAAAWLFAKFLTTNIELQAKMSMNNGYASAVQSITQNPVYAEFLASADGNLNLQATAVQQTIDMSAYYFVSPAFDGSSDARDEVGLLVQRCLANKPANGQTVADFIKKCFEDSIKTLED